MKIHLLIIDPENDFMDTPGAALPVPGANDDMIRLATMVRRVGYKLDDIHVTLDSHRAIDIAHPIWWVNQAGENPAPFTIITADDIRNGIWTPRIPSFRNRSLAYSEALEAKGNFQLQIWNPHCLISTWGANVQKDLNEALQWWSNERFGMVDYVTKGSNPFTEHYDALESEVPDPDDPGTSLNTDFLDMLISADIIAVAGEALSH